MNNAISYEKAQSIVLNAVLPISGEYVPLVDCGKRVLAENVVAQTDVPSFDRSPYDGYAFRALDTLNASRKNPVTLRILEEIPAGGVSHFPVVSGTAVKVSTGAPIPPDADAVVMYEKTDFTEDYVTVYDPFSAGDNIVCAGEDVKIGTILARAGTAIDAGLCGTIASQNVELVYVHRIPKIGLISTGSELLEPGMPDHPGMIFNSNRYVFTTELRRMGMFPRYDQ